MMQHTEGDKYICSCDETVTTNRTPLEKLLQYILQHEKIADTPILNLVSVQKNLMLIKVEKTHLLQNFASCVKSDRLRFLTTDWFQIVPVSLEDGICNAEPVFVQVRVYLNGKGAYFNQSVSMSLTLKNMTLHNHFVITFFLFDQSRKENYHRASFQVSEWHEKKHMGLLDFISKQKLKSFVVENNQSVLFGVQIFVASSK